MSTIQRLKRSLEHETRVENFRVVGVLLHESDLLTITEDRDGHHVGFLGGVVAAPRRKDRHLGRFRGNHDNVREPVDLVVDHDSLPCGAGAHKRSELAHLIERVHQHATAQLSIDGKSVNASYTAPEDLLSDGKLLDKAIAHAKCLDLIGKQLNNVVVEYSVVSEHPPLPFNLVKLQSYCSSHFGYDPSKVMEITQSLRDKHNAITYNRSDCQYLSEEQYKEAPATMQQVIKNIGFTPKAMDMTLHSRAYNDKNITAHTAIIPQNQAVDLSKLTEQEKNVYLAIVKYFMVQFMPPAKKGRSTLKAQTPDGGTLSATSIRILSPGYLSLFKNGTAEESGDEKEEESALSSIKPGTYNASVISTDLAEKETKPPARYTKASLNEDMTRIAKYVKDPEIKKLLLSKDKGKKGENGSIGTSATRADIIDGLVVHGYLEEQGKKIISTPLGRELCRILPGELTRPDLTAKWWAIQEDIQAGNATPEDLTGNVLDMIEHTINTQYPSVDINKIPSNLRRGGMRESLGKCPRCGCDVVEGKNGFGCSGWKNGCKFVIWKKSKSSLFSKTTFTAADVKKVLSGKPIHKTTLVSMKTGSPKTFEADLIMEDDPNSQYGPSFKLDFSNNKPKTGAKATRSSGTKKKGGGRK